jgi:glycosyltransferase involved in cell wall biosynthesis
MGNKRILYVVHRSWPYLGGAERLFWEWAKSSRDAGYDVTIFTTDVWDIEYFHDKGRRRIEVSEENVDGITVRRFKIAFFPKMIRERAFKILPAVPFPMFKYVFGYPHILLPGYLLKMLLMRQRFDIVNAGVFPHVFLTYPAIQYARRKQIPCICTPLVHLGQPHSINKAYHFLGPKQVELLKGCDHVISLTDIERKALLSKGIPDEKTHVISAGIDPDEVKGGVGERFRNRYGIRGKVVLQLSTQTHDKGALHTVEAMKRLWHQGMDATLVLMGQVMSDFDSYFFRQSPWVYEKTLVLDYSDEQTKKDALDACDVLVMPSKADSFGIVYLEAWLYKKPVIGAYAGGIPDVIHDGKDGFLVPYGDIHMLSEYIEQLLSYPALAEAMGANGRSKVLEHYTWTSSCEKLQALYRQALK